MLRSSFLWLFLLIPFSLFAQRRQGSWQDYLSYSNAVKIAVAGEKVFCATEGGLFYYDRQDNSIRKFSGIDGLSDFGVRTMAWNQTSRVLVIAYENSNIDLVYESRIVNLSDILRKQITGDKKIYNISFSGSEAYLSCGFGIVALNLEKQEIKDTYYIGEGGTSLQVNDVAVLGSSVFAATNQGIYQADKDGNLLDFRSWSRVTTIPHAEEKFSHLVNHAGDLLANYTSDQYSGDELYRLHGEVWERYNPAISYVGDAQSNGNLMAIASRSLFYIVDENHNIKGMFSSYMLESEEAFGIQPRSVGMAEDGSAWVADYGYGLVRLTGGKDESIFPDGPMDNQIFSLHAHEGDLWVTPGGRSDSWNNTWQQPRFQVYRDGQWEHFMESDFPVLGEDFFDVVDIVADPADPEHIFVASWGGGVLEFRGRQFLNRYTNFNSPLESALPEQPASAYVRIGGMDFDSEGNLWITNSEVAKNLLKFSPGGEWETFVLPEVANSRNIGQVLVSENDDKWIIVPRGHDAYVVDKTGERKRRLQVTSYFNNGEREIFNRMNDVYCMAEDLDGAIWMGTSKGVAVYNNPERIWDTQLFFAVQPALDLNDGLYHPLLETETVTAIAVDGANRKWIGTRGAGVFLVSAAGDREIHHFTPKNSPLLSDNILDIAINQNSGEVFIATSEGLISYQGSAVGGRSAFENVVVYPNPVRETWDGPVSVTGLMEDTDVKITDISGNLVFQTTSLGGQAVWDGKNLNGNRVKTGVYLVFCSAVNGEETHIEKLLFIH